MSLSIQNISNQSVLLGNNEFRSGVITFGGAGTLAAGTILATDTSTEKYIPFVKGGSTNGNGVPTAVLRNAVTATGAGDVAARPCISGEVRFENLIIDADGDNSNVSNNVLDALKSSMIVTIKAEDLNGQDNQ